MAFALLPLFVVIFFAGVMAQTASLSSSVPGAGADAVLLNKSKVAAQQALVFATQCQAAAIQAPGYLGVVAVTMPANLAAPPGAQCQTTPNAGGGRNIFSSVPEAAGEAAQILALTQGSYLWWRVPASNTAVNLLNNQQAAVSNIPTGSLVSWITTNP